MSEKIIQKVPSSNGLIMETDNIVNESGVNNEDEETWLYENNKSKGDENVDNTTAPSIDEITTQEIDAREKATIPLSTIPTTISLIDNQLDDDSDDDDDGIEITIGNYEPEAPSFQTNRQKGRTTIPGGPVMLPKPPTIRGVDFDAQGVINGQPTYEYDLMHSYKDEEKPWKKPGADISDYFNYGFTEETWAQYCDRQRRLRSENNLARLNIAHLPPMSPMIPGHPPMLHPMNHHSVMMINKPMNMQMMPRPFMNIRKPDGKIDVIGATDLTSRRPMFDSPNNFDHPPFIGEPSFPGGQPPNGQTVGDLVSSTPSTNGPPPPRGTPPNNTHSIPTHGMHRLPMMLPPPGMQFRPPFGRPHGPGGPQFFPHGPGGGMHGERPPQSYFVPRHPQQQQQQQLWDKPGVPPGHGFPPGHFPPQAILPGPGGNGRAPVSRSPTPEDHSSRSSTPEENRPSASGGAGGGDNEKSSKDDRYKDRYRDDRDYQSRRRSSPKDRSSSAYRSHHRSGDHEYERPRNERKPSRDRDDKYERFSRKRHHHEDSTRHPQQRGDDESSRNYRSARRTPPKTVNSISSVPVSTELPSQIIAEHPEPLETADQPLSSPLNRSRRDESERSSSRHTHHKKSSKRSRHDSGDERTSSHHHHRRSKDKSSSSSKKLINQTESLSDAKEQIIE